LRDFKPLVSHCNHISAGADAKTQKLAKADDGRREKRKDRPQMRSRSSIFKGYAAIAAYRYAAAGVTTVAAFVAFAVAAATGASYGL